MECAATTPRERPWRACEVLIVFTFAYGSNLDEAQMAERCPSARLVGVARLVGFRLTFNRFSHGWDGGVADVVRGPGSEVWGIVWKLDEADLRCLDEYEVVPEGYVREELEVELSAGRTIEAWVYQVTRKSSFVAPRSEYAEILRHACDRFDFPASYRDAVEAAIRGS